MTTATSARRKVDPATYDLTRMRKLRRVLDHVEPSRRHRLRSNGTENVELMREVMKEITKERKRGRWSRFDMGLWFGAQRPFRGGEELPCGTTACLAGWGLIVSMTSRETLRPDHWGQARQFVAGNGVEMSINDAARRRFNLNWDQADWLFGMTYVDYKTLKQAISYVFGEDFR